jgi:hypothetical protein
MDYTIVKTIREQLLTLGRIKVWSWGAHAWRAVDESTLQFKVQGHHFKGHVRVEYDFGMDVYHVHFGRWRNGQWQHRHTIEEVYVDELVHVIDHTVEYIPYYQD